MSRELPQSLVKKFAKISSHRLITKVIDWFEEDGYDYNDIIEMLDKAIIEKEGDEITIEYEDGTVDGFFEEDDCVRLI
jgi:hypothetical protein